MTVARRIAYNVVFNSTLKIVSTVFIALLSIRLTTGYLGQAGFGEYATVLAFFAFFGALGDLGLATVVAREISRHNAPEEKILANVASLRLFFSGCIILLAPLIVTALHYSSEVKGGIILMSVALFFAQFGTFLNGIFQKRLIMDRVAMIEFVGKLLQLSIIFATVKLDLGFTMIVAANFVAMAFNATVEFILSRRYIRFLPRIDFAFWKGFLREAFPLGVTTLIVFVYFKTDTILLSFLQSSEEVGIYNVAYKITENLIFFPAMLVGLVMPLLSKSIYHRPEEFREIADKTAKVFFVIIIPLVLGTLFLAPTIIGLVSGGGFEESANVLRILIFALAAIFFGQYFNMLLIVGNAQKKLMYGLFGVAVFNVALNLILIPRYSYLGSAVTAALTETLVVLVTAWLTYRTLNYFPRPGRLFPIVLSGLSMAVALYLTRELPFLVSGLLSFGTYLFMLWVSRAISSEELVSLFSQKSEPQMESPLLS